MSENNDPWTAGVDSWWRTMLAGREALEDLGRQRKPTPEVAAEDLARVLEALALLERQASALEARVDALQEQLVALTGAVSTLADALLER